MAKEKWIEKKFDFNLSQNEFPNILNRLRETPEKIEQLIYSVSPEILTKKIDDSWSIQEHIGHIIDLEELLFFYLCLTGCIASMGPLMVQQLPILPDSGAAWMGVATVALFSIIAQLTINQALIKIPATIVSVIMTAEVPLVACFGVLYLNEPLGWRLIVGASLIFGCGVGLSLLPARPATE